MLDSLAGAVCAGLGAGLDSARLSSSSVIASDTRSRYLAAASKQMPIANITPPVTAHRPRPVMNEPPISPTP